MHMIRTLTPPHRSVRSHLWLPSHRGHDPPPSRSSTLGLNDARFRGRWAGRPRSFETVIKNHPRPQCCRPVCPSRSLPSVSAKPREEIEELWLRSIYHGSARHRTAYLPAVTLTWKYRGEDAHQRLKPCPTWIMAVWQDRQAAVLGSATLKGTLFVAAIILDCERLETRTLRCMPCVNILPGTVEWSHVMQVKYKLQAVVNNRHIICTLDFLSFWQLSLICCGICYNGLQGNNSQQCDSVYSLFALTCVDMKHEQDGVLQLH